MSWRRPIEPVEFRGVLAPNLRPTPRHVRPLPPRTGVISRAIYRALKAMILRAHREGDTATLEAIGRLFEPANPWE